MKKIILFKIRSNTNNLSIQEGQTLKSREALMKQHREHWGAVRRKWHKQAHKNEQRFAESATILGTIFKR